MAKEGDCASDVTAELASRIVVRVTPRASRSRILPDQAPDGVIAFRVWVTAAPERGKANEETLRLVANEVGVPVSGLKISRGLQSRTKTITVRR